MSLDFQLSEYDFKEKSLSDSAPDEKQSFIMKKLKLDLHDSIESENFDNEILSPVEIRNHMLKLIGETNEVIKLPQTTTRILLDHFNWDKDKLLECYFDCDYEKLFFDAGIINPSHEFQKEASLCEGSAGKEPKLNSKSLEICIICYLEWPKNAVTGLECGHRFCKTCWLKYLNTKIMQDEASPLIFCPSHQCKMLVDDEFVQDMLEDHRVIQRYQQSINKNFIECNRLLRLCPRPDCGRAVKVAHVEFRPVTCTCGITFCFLCADEWHFPIDCRLLKLWRTKCGNQPVMKLSNEESESLNWILRYTKKCPKCQVPIEKNGGCNHMTCTNKKCAMEFCWHCLNAWESHGAQFFSCNRFETSDGRNSRNDQQEDTGRFDFYSSRYFNHLESLKFEEALHHRVGMKMAELQKQEISWSDVKFLKKAVEVLCQCRQTLRFTYVFAFYLMEENQVQIFEFNQRDLESKTEILSECLERDLMTRKDFSHLRQEIQHKYRLCEAGRNLLIGHCREGYDKGWWRFSE